MTMEGLFASWTDSTTAGLQPRRSNRSPSFDESMSLESAATMNSNATAHSDENQLRSITEQVNEMSLAENVNNSIPTFATPSLHQPRLLPRSHVVRRTLAAPPIPDSPALVDNHPPQFTLAAPHNTPTENMLLFLESSSPPQIPSFESPELNRRVVRMLKMRPAAAAVMLFP